MRLSLDRITRQITRKAARKAVKARTRESLPFSGVFRHGEPVNPPTSGQAFERLMLSPIVALLLMQSSASRRYR